MATERLFETCQEVRAPREEVFAFFCDLLNLEVLTPPWLRFRILTLPTLPTGEGAVYDYHLSIHGLPVSWRSRIEVWEPGRRFVDRQDRGPYALWHHTHTFEDLGHASGTGCATAFPSVPWAASSCPWFNWTSSASSTSADKPSPTGFPRHDKGRFRRW
jgi:hypothetical protein